MIYSIEELQNRITPIAKKYEVKRVILFGSYARNEATEQSDIDIIIEKGEFLKGYKQYSNFYHELLDTLGKEIDLLTFYGVERASNKRLIDAIREEGVLLYDSSIRL